MKKSKKILASALALASVISVASCGGRSENATGTTPEETEATWQTNDTMAELQDAVANVEVDTSINVTKKLKWLAWWPQDETDAVWETFKLNYGIPEQGDEKYGEYKDSIVIFDNIEYAERINALTTRIMAGDSPDICAFDIRDFPLATISSNPLVQPVDGVVDTYAPEYAESRSTMDKFMWNNKNYCAIAPSEITMNTLFWYRKSVIADTGLPDPLTLYKEGKWDWDALADMLKQYQNTGADKNGIDGYLGDYLGAGIVCSTGVPVVSLENGRCINNTRDPAIERAMAYLAQFPRNGWIQEGVKNGTIKTKEFTENKNTLFWIDGSWFYTEQITPLFSELYNKKGKLLRGPIDEPGDLLCVPFPRDPQADKYYCQIQNGCKMFVKGSQNPEGFKAYCSCVIATANNEEVKKTTREKNKRDYGWTDELLDLLDQYPKEISPVFDFQSGINVDAMDYGKAMKLTFNAPVANENFDFIQQREENFNTIQSWVDEINSYLD